MRARWVLAVAAAVSLSLAACGGGDDSSSDTTGATTTTAGDPTTTVEATTTTAAPAAVSYFEPGPYAVGVTTLTVGDRQAEVWYPVDPASVEGQETEIFDSLSVFPESLKPLIPKELQGEIDTGAYRDAPAATEGGPFPVIHYSHGFGGYRQVATFLTTNYASHGFVVASVDHLERGIAAQATNQLKRIPGKDVEDIQNTYDALVAENAKAGSLLEGLVDPEHVGIIGHSAGAGTSAAAARDLDIIDAWVSLSGGIPTKTEGEVPGLLGVRVLGETPATFTVTISNVTPTEATVVVDGGEPTVVSLAEDAAPEDTRFPIGDGQGSLFVDPETPLAAGTTTVSIDVAEKPAMVVLGDQDGTVLPEASRGLYANLPPPKWLIDIAGAGHNSFTDSCVRIRELGGLQALVPLLGEAQVARAEDGCTDEYVDPVKAQAVLDQYSTAFFTQELKGEDSSASLAKEAIDLIGGISFTDYQSET